MQLRLLISLMVMLKILQQTCNFLFKMKVILQARSTPVIKQRAVKNCFTFTQANSTLFALNCALVVVTATVAFFSHCIIQNIYSPN
jgi:hypothetical protein